MKRIPSLLYCLIVILLSVTPLLTEQATEVKVGLGVILSGDMAVFGQGDLRSATTYLKHYSRHKIRLIPEDTRLTSSEGLRAYQKLINLDKVDVLIAAGTSNGIMAAKSLVHSSKTVTLMASTGGYNIDQAGPWVFRTGNSDTLNGVQQAEHFIDKAITKVALLTELTEYTTDISKAFKKVFLNAGGRLVYDQSFLPNTSDFRSEITNILSKAPQAIFMPTQTGTALGIFIKQLRTQEKNKKTEVHTTMVAAPNPDAHEIAGKNILGVYYMDPNYDSQGKLYQDFLRLYQQEYQSPPPVPFHTAAVIESLELLQKFLDQYRSYDNQKFKRYLNQELGKTCGYMGCYSLDENGNSNLGFHASKITKLQK